MKAIIKVEIKGEFYTEAEENEYVESLDHLLTVLSDVTRGVKTTHEIKGVDNV